MWLASEWPSFSSESATNRDAGAGGSLESVVPLTGGPKVRIHFPPAVSQVRTAIGPPELPVAPPKQAQALSSTGGERVGIHGPTGPLAAASHRDAAPARRTSHWIRLFVGNHRHDDSRRHTYF